MCDHFHQPVIGLVYLCQQVWLPVLVVLSVCEASNWQSCLRREQPSPPTEQPDVVVSGLWGNGASSATGDFPARGTLYHGYFRSEIEVIILVFCPQERDEGKKSLQLEMLLTAPQVCPRWQGCWQKIKPNWLSEQNI